MENEKPEKPEQPVPVQDDEKQMVVGDAVTAEPLSDPVIKQDDRLGKQPFRSVDEDVE